MVKQIVELRTPFGAIPLSEMEGLGDRKVHAVVLGSAETVAARAAVCSIGRRRQNASILDVATVICQRSKSERLLCRIRVWSHRGCVASRLDRGRCGGKGRDAGRKYPVARNPGAVRDDKRASG